MAAERICSAGILERASGKPLEAFAREALFEPLGITDCEWKNYPKNGKIAAAAGLRLRPRDAAKIGQLVLNRGTWNGQQIVSADWIEKSITPRFQAAGYFGGTCSTAISGGWAARSPGTRR